MNQQEEMSSLILRQWRSCVVICQMHLLAMTSSVSFRITRTAEELAQTITALTQRLVKIEQRQEVMEMQLRQQLKNATSVADEEQAALDGIESLLRETRELLQNSEISPAISESEALLMQPDDESQSSEYSQVA